MNDKIQFKRILGMVGEGSYAITLPPEVVKYIDAQKGDEITIIVDTNKKGQKYIAVFKEQK